MEDELINRIMKGDTYSFKLLYDKYVSRIYTLALRMTGSTQHAEDLTQEIFIRIWKKIHLFKNKSNFLTWATRLAINVILSNLKNKKHETDFEAISQQIPDKSSHEQDEIFDLENAIAKLPKRMKLILVLHELQGYSHVDISEMAGISEGTSKALLHKAKIRLKEVMGE